MAKILRKQILKLQQRRNAFLNNPPSGFDKSAVRNGKPRRIPNSMTK